MSRKRKKSSARTKVSARSSKTQPKANGWWIGIALVAVVVVAIVLISQANAGNSKTSSLADISVQAAYQKYQQGAFLLDVRTQAEWDEYHIPGAMLIPLDELPYRWSEVPADREIVVVCRSGNRSQEGRDILRQAGFTQVSSMAGGVSQWRAAGYPVEP